MRRVATVIAVVLLLEGCISPAGIVPAAIETDPALLAASRTLADAKLAPGVWPGTEWWATLGDPPLDTLIREALGTSPSLGLARARIAAAEAAVVAAGGPLGLGVSLTGSASRQRLSEHGLVPAGYGGRLITQSQLSMEFAWEFDFWDRNRSALEAEIGRLNAAATDQAAAVLALSTRIAQVYLGLAAIVARRATAEGLLVRREAMTRLARERVASGLDAQIGQREAESAAAAARGAVAALEAEAAAARHQLAALAGKGPDHTLGLVPGRMSTVADDALPSLLPADLVGRRPDVAALRQRIEASGRDIESARAAYYPNLNLAAYVGLQSIGLARLLDAGSTVFGVGPALRLPLFGSARLTSALVARNAERDALVEAYNARVVDALREIVDLVAFGDALRLQQVEAERAVSSGAEVLVLLRAREQAGLTGRLPVLEAESRQLEREQQLSDLRSERLVLRVALARALGGGFDPAGGDGNTTETGNAAAVKSGAVPVKGQTR